jgi:hypothetical protein
MKFKDGQMLALSEQLVLNHYWLQGYLLYFTVLTLCPAVTIAGISQRGENVYEHRKKMWYYYRKCLIYSHASLSTDSVSAF